MNTENTQPQPAQHTPGPWTIRNRAGYDGQIWAENAMSAQLSIPIAETLSIGAVDDANARLIAAAPELLAALKAAVRDLRAMVAEVAHGSSDKICLCTGGKLIAGYCAAIAAAEGKR